MSAASYTPSAVVIKEAPGELIITVPAAPQGPPGDTFFITFWLIFWIAGGGACLWALFGPRPKTTAEVLFMVVWLIFWGVALIQVFCHLLWTRAGRQTLVLRADGLSLTNRVLGLSRTGFFPRYVLLNMHAVEPPELGSGIRFDHGWTEVSFSAGLGAEESRRLVARLREYDVRWHHGS